MRVLSKKNVELPKSARWVEAFWNPETGKVMLQVFRTKAVVYVRTDETDPHWRKSSPEEAHVLIERARDLFEAIRKKALGRHNRRQFVEHLATLRRKREAQRGLKSWQNEVEAAYLRLWLKTSSLKDRVALDLALTALMEAASEAARDGEPFPDLPDGWGEAMPWTVSETQMALRL